MVTQPLSGGPKMGAEKLIIQWEKVRFNDILSLLLLRWPITSYPFVEAGDQTAADLGSTPGDWVVALTEFILKALNVAYCPALFIGAAVEFLNFIALNNGILGIEMSGKDAAQDFPKTAPNTAADKPVAYYKLREVLREQIKKHPMAKLVVTGHSLGGALAVIFPATLAFHGERDILDRLLSVTTYGQPRVGDKTFAAYVRANVPVEPIRVVYRCDVVPRVPFDAPPVAEFTHGGTCVYFDGWYDGRAIAAGGDVPNPNYIDPRYLLSMYGNAWGDLFKGAFLWAKEGSDYREGAVSLLYRAAGPLVPGVASHSPRDYVNAIRLGRIATKEA